MNKRNIFHVLTFLKKNIVSQDPLEFYILSSNETVFTATNEPLQSIKCQYTPTNRNAQWSQTDLKESNGENKNRKRN